MNNQEDYIYIPEIKYIVSPEGKSWSESLLTYNKRISMASHIHVPSNSNNGIRRIGCIINSINKEVKWIRFNHSSFVGVSGARGKLVLDPCCSC